MEATAARVPEAVDAHVHLLDPTRFEYGWPAHDRMARPWLLDELSADASSAGIGSFVAVQALDDDAETDWLLETAATDQRIVAVVGWVNLRDDPDRISARLADLVARGVRGIRHRAALEADPTWLLRDDVARGLEAVAHAELPFELLLLPGQLDQVSRLSERHPALDMVLDHLGLPDLTDQEHDAWRRDLIALAANPRITCKVSGLLRLGARSTDLESLRRHARSALDAFGPERLMFATDWPIATNGCPYREAVDVVVDTFGPLSAISTSDLLAATARRVYRVS